jgi:hypothetical protein
MTPQELKRKEEIMEKARNFLPFDSKDDFRIKDAGYYGGYDLLDKELTSRLRSSGKEILKQVGKSILSGSFNLTTISFPIKCMSSKSMLELMKNMCCVNPLYLNKAAMTSDPIERVKMCMTQSIAYIIPSHIFEKPVSFPLQILLKYS